MRIPVLPLALALALAATACGASATRGAALYHDGRYIEAAEVFERTERRLDTTDGDACAHYGMYRGMTFLRLDDLRGARQWLSYAFAAERSEPGALSDSDRQALQRAWAELERREREAPQGEASPPPTVAASDGAPRGPGTAPNGQRSLRVE